MLDSPNVLHIPHSSRMIPSEVRPLFCVSELEIQVELLRQTDAYTDELFDYPAATRIVFPISRLVVDPERFRSDEDEVMASRGLGAVYTRMADGRALKRVPRPESLLQAFYDPHHQRLEEAVSLALTQFGQCQIVDCHSFPTEPLPCDLDQRPGRPDACLGIDAFHTPPEWVDRALDAFRKRRWTCEVDRPYAGTIVPMAHYRRDSRVGSIMIEVNRSRYMNESTGERSNGFAETMSTISSVLEAVLEGVAP